MRVWAVAVVVAACAASVASAQDMRPDGKGGAVVRPGSVVPTTVVDDFDDISAWSAHPADGVTLGLAGDEDVVGRSLRLDVHFVTGGGYAVARRAVSLDLPANYRFRLHVRGDIGPEDLEFKLIDSTGANVWWCNRRNFVFPREWTELTTRKRDITFAWGPLGGGEPRHIASIEFAVTAGSGGQGSVWLDDLTLEELPVPPAVPPRPVASASSGVARFAVDGVARTAWTTARGDASPWLMLDLGYEREFGGLSLDWAPGAALRDYDVQTSSDHEAWATVREVRGGNGGRDEIYAPNAQARYVRIRAASPRGCALREVTVRPLEWSATMNDYVRALAASSPRGTYPRGMSGEQAFWTIAGVDGADDEALVGEDGAVEHATRSFSLEPFLLDGPRLVTWADARVSQSLADGCLPIPTVTWRTPRFELHTTTYAFGAREQSALLVRYAVRNLGATRATPRLVLAARPFQVNPPSQWLNVQGGWSPIDSIAESFGTLFVNGVRACVPIEPSTDFRAQAFTDGDIVASLRGGWAKRALAPTMEAQAAGLGEINGDAMHGASAAYVYDLTLAPHGEQTVDVLMPLGDDGDFPPGLALPRTRAGRRAWADSLAASVHDAWAAQVAHIALALPDSLRDVENAVKAQVCYMLVTRDGGALKPGTRAYDRSWIRDGAMEATALLRLGLREPAREFVEWFATKLFDNGKVPCCVDARGPDPTPENDSGGQFIYAVAEYVRATGDRAFAASLWPAASHAAAYLDSLRQLRRTPDYEMAERNEFYGLLPESISHEGYSAKPMHSYWDDLWALRGFTDIVYLAGVCGHADDVARWQAVRDEFARELSASIAVTMQKHRIDYIPGCAELGDFDATSTTIALDPVEAGDVLPRAALERTFEKYWAFFTARRDGRAKWDAYTPYEMRCIGALALLGHRDRADAALRYFMGARRPAGWQQFPEVIWRENRKPHFIGDLPHTWVGSDFVRSVLTLYPPSGGKR